MPDADGDFQPLFSLLNRKKKLALAISGGPDSCALMVLVAQWAQHNDCLPDLHVLTVDHDLREGSRQEAVQVCAWAKELGLPCTVLKWRHAGVKTGVQQNARQGRYELMGAWCREHGFAGVVTAHSRDDQAETMLMRLARGSGVAGLGAMAERSDVFGVVVYRPFLDIPRDRLRDVLIAAGHAWIDDPSNDDEQFERVRVRGAMPLIEQAGIDRQALALSAARLRRANEALERVVDGVMTASVTVFDAGFCEVDRGGFERLEDDIAIRVLARLLCWAGGRQTPVRLAKIERLFDAMQEGKVEKHTLAGARLLQRKSTFIIGREFGRIDAGLQSQVTGWDNRFVFATGQNVQPYGVYIDDDNRTRPETLPHFVACSLPVFVGAKGAIVVPHLDVCDELRPKLCCLPAGVEEVHPLPLVTKTQSAP